MANINKRLACIGEFRLRRATNAPHRAGLSDVGEVQREVHRHRALGRNGDAAFELAVGGDSVVQFEFHIGFDGLAGLVVDHRLRNELIAHAAEARQCGFHHQGLVNSETGFRCAKAIARMRDSKEAIASETVGRGEAHPNAAFSIRA